MPVYSGANNPRDPNNPMYDYAHQVATERQSNAIKTGYNVPSTPNQVVNSYQLAHSDSNLVGENPFELLATAAKNYLIGDLDWARQQEVMKYNAKEAEKDRDWQQMMRQTYYQDAANSALAAGFNPAFAMGGSASSPSGAAAHYSGALRSSEGVGHLLTGLFGLVGQLVATGMRTSAMEAAQDIRGQYTIDAAKLRGNNALVISKNISDAAMERAQLRSKTAKFNAVRYTPEYFERANLSAERMAAHKYFKDVDSNTMKKLYDLMKDPMGRVMVMHTYKEWQKGN